LPVIKTARRVVYFTCSEILITIFKVLPFCNKKEDDEMAIVNISDQTFKSEVETGGTVLVDFWAPWCGPCRMIAPVLEELDKEIGDQVKIAKLNVDENPESASRFGVMSIPTLIVFKDGQPVDKVIGFQPKDSLKSVVSRHM
jgi:thioredoxin 1